MGFTIGSREKVPGKRKRDKSIKTLSRIVVKTEFEACHHKRVQSVTLDLRYVGKYSPVTEKKISGPAVIR
jgi:hypothetical protein